MSERVEKLVEKVVVLHEGKLVIRWPKLGFWSFFGAAGRDVTAEEFEFVKSAVRAALLEARREALKEAAGIAFRAAKKFSGPGGQSATQMEANRRSAEACKGIAIELERLAGEERTK